jgi:predicted nucleotidyltransferase component of viral defense system
MAFDYLEQIKRLSIIAIFSDDDFMEKFVLKGGNVLDLVYRVSVRSSIDIDLSMEEEFDVDTLDMIKAKFQRILESTFHEKGYAVFDVEFQEKPKEIHPELKDFWGGYEIRFKVIRLAEYKKFSSDIASLRRNALVVGPKNVRTYSIEISKFEYCEEKTYRVLDGYRIYLYTPEMIVIEKLRAICQQMPEYKEIVHGTYQTARARDFVDIYHLTIEYGIKINSKDNIELLKNIFGAKRVPLRLLNEINKFREFHREDFRAVVDTVKAGVKLKDFNFYFDYVVRICDGLKPLWKV